eukprot:6135053-Pleurochrysis_carterae.AAC.2
MGDGINVVFLSVSKTQRARLVWRVSPASEAALVGYQLRRAGLVRHRRARLARPSSRTKATTVYIYSTCGCFLQAQKVHSVRVTITPGEQGSPGTD